jgi:hypothetical protein
VQGTVTVNQLDRIIEVAVVFPQFPGVVLKDYQELY